MIKFHSIVFAVFGFGYAAGETPTGEAGARYPLYSPSTLHARAHGLCSPPYLRIEDEHIASVLSSFLIIALSLSNEG
jgi:hypothetical protein